MEIHIVNKSDGLGGSVVDKVFDDYDDALDYAETLVHYINLNRREIARYNVKTHKVIKGKDNGESS